MKATADGLRISPRFSSVDWDRLSKKRREDWGTAVEIVRDRLEGRFLKFVDQCLPDPFSGFIVLSVDSLLVETAQQFRLGLTDGRNKSGALIKEFLSGPRFQPAFDALARKRFYEDIRCGLLHQAEAKEMWLVRRGQPAMLQQVTAGDGYIIDVVRFHQAVRDSLEDYYRELVDPSANDLRAKLWNKMDHISRIRTARGALLEATSAQTHQAT